MDVVWCDLNWARGGGRRNTHCSSLRNFAEDAVRSVGRKIDCKVQDWEPLTSRADGRYVYVAIAHLIRRLLAWCVDIYATARLDASVFFYMDIQQIPPAHCFLLRRRFPTLTREKLARPRRIYQRRTMNGP